jgi:DNA-binding response OmpR family regulator
MTRILSLDDETPMLELINLILERAGYEHIYTRDSQEALEMLRHQPVDIFTQDIMRPDIDGWEFYYLMRSEDMLRNIPVLIITCQAQSREKFSGLHLAHVDGYLTKPFGPQELLDSIKTILAAHAKAPPTEEERLRARLRREQALRHRAELLAQVIAVLPNAHLHGQTVKINGYYGRYEVSLTSGKVMRSPNQHVCIVPAPPRGVRPALSLPFEEIGMNTEQIIATILLLAADEQITDELILRQLKETAHERPSVN